MTAADRIAAIAAAYEAQRKYAARTKAKGGKAAKLAQLRQDVRDAWEEHGPYMLPILEGIVREAEKKRAIKTVMEGE